MPGIAPAPWPPALHSRDAATGGHRPALLCRSSVRPMPNRLSLEIDWPSRQANGLDHQLCSPGSYFPSLMLCPVLSAPLLGPPGFWLPTLFLSTLSSVLCLSSAWHPYEDTHRLRASGCLGGTPTYPSPTPVGWERSRAPG